MTIKHVSFDAWNTVIQANPRFTEARLLILANELNLSFERAKAKYAAAKKAADNLATSEQHVPSTPELWTELCDGNVLVGTKLMHMTALAFMQHPPVMPDNVRRTLSHLTTKGVTCSITSNTNFISGVTLWPILQHLSGNAFSFGVFSDLINVSKPCPDIFLAMVADAQQLSDQVTTMCEIVHVGDHEICDVAGGNSVGLRTALTHVSHLSPQLFD